MVWTSASDVLLYVQNDLLYPSIGTAAKRDMTSSKQLVLLLAIALVAGAAAHRLGLGAVLDADRSPHRSLLDQREVSAEAVERQRIFGRA